MSVYDFVSHIGETVALQAFAYSTPNGPAIATSSDNMYLCSRIALDLYRCDLVIELSIELMPAPPPAD